MSLVLMHARSFFHGGVRSMDLYNAVWRFSFGKDKHVAYGRKALDSIYSLLVKAITKHEGAPHALTPDEIAPIKAICDQLVPANFQLNVPTSERCEPTRRKRVAYKHIYEDKTFSIGIFILPPGVAIPLHDHPGMSVISRMLYGSLHFKSYDLVKNNAIYSGSKQPARLCVEKIITAPYTMEVLPESGNLHELIGGDDIGCAFLDIITPPYDVEEGRNCTYFRVVDSISSQHTENEKLWLLEKHEPQDFVVVTETYCGPHISSTLN